MIKRAISIRQPWVEQILRGIKKKEYRDIPTNIRERVYLYASLKPDGAPNDWRRVRKDPGIGEVAMPTILPVPNGWRPHESQRISRSRSGGALVFRERW